jgi:Spy/CpxP family protein refolding chaperone
MKIITTKNSLLRSSMAFAVMIAIYTPASSWSAEPTEGKEMKMESKMMEKCEEMKKEKQKMQAEMKAQDAELTAAVATMNSAAQDKKLDLVAAVVTRLVEQRSAMHAQKAKMEEKMMKHMMEHMEMGKESMSKCPMMKGMDEKSDGAHAEHHGKSE